jgi:L-threonylcarbamoyladenylate synthase
LRTKKINRQSADQALPVANVESALAALRAGEAIVFPTETFYAVGVDALNRHALENLFQLKGRDPDKPVALIAANLEMVARVAAEIPPAARRLAGRFWPGPLTIVLPARAELARELTNREGGVGIRVSPHPIALELTRRLGSPLTATSANPAGQPPARTLGEAWRSFGDAIAAYVDGGALTGELPSTVVALEGGKIKILRAGAVPEETLMQALRD